MRVLLFLLFLSFSFPQDEAPDWLNFDDEEKPGASNDVVQTIAPQGWSNRETQLTEDERPLPSRSMLPSLDRWSGSPHILKQEIRKEFKQKNYAKSLELIEILVAHEPQQIEMLYKKAFALRQTGEFQESLEVYNEVINAKPKFRDAWYDRGGVLAKLGQFQDAVKSYDQAIVLNGNLTWLHYDRAVLLRKMQNWTEALQGFKKAVELSPKNSWAHLELGNMYFSINQYVHAMKYYQKALEINPKIPGAKKNLTFCVKFLEGK